MDAINSNCHQGGLLCPEFFLPSHLKVDRLTSNEQTDRQTEAPKVCVSQSAFQSHLQQPIGPTSSLSLNTNNRYLNQHHSADMVMNTQLLLPSTSPLFTKILPATNISPFWVTNC